MKAGRPARFDYEYERNGTANLFMMFAALIPLISEVCETPLRLAARVKLRSSHSARK